MLLALASPACAQGAGTVAPAPPAAVVAEQAIRAAALRFGLPVSWIRAVIRAESGGNPMAVSDAGAIGLMQLMPTTYSELRRRYRLGPDPFDISDNVMAGTAYLRELHDRYGGRGMLAAYNAGPARWEAHLRGTRALPRETMSYLARLGPSIGFAAMSGRSRDRSAAPASPSAAPLFASRTAAARAPTTGGVAAAATDPGDAAAPPNALFAIRFATSRRPGHAAVRASSAGDRATPAQLPRLARPGAAPAAAPLSGALFVAPTSAAPKP